MRRTAAIFLVAVLAIVATIGLGIGGVGDAGASVSATTQVGETTVSGASPSGQVHDVAVTIDGTVEWSGFENGVDEISFIYSASGDGVRGADSEVVSPPDPGSSGSANIADLYSNPGIRVEASGIEPPAEGETITRTIPVNVTITVSNFEGESAEYTETHDVTVEITNLPENGTSDEPTETPTPTTPEPTMDATIEWEVDVVMTEEQ